MNKQPLVEFYRAVSQARHPKRAERSAAGFLPSRAMRYCDALTSATGFGYWVFPPITFRLVWDGENILWSLDEDGEWMPLSGTISGAVQFPDYCDDFDNVAPDYLTGYAPPFLTAMPEVGGVQIWTGLIARTRPGWSLNVRSPVNLPGISGLVAWEGIVETDVWVGPLFNNFRITRTDSPVVIRANQPFLQVQPVPQIAYRDDVLGDFTCRELDSLAETDWVDLSKVLLPTTNAALRQGDYAVAVRKRRLCPVAHSDLLPE